MFIEQELASPFKPIEALGQTIEKYEKKNDNESYTGQFRKRYIQM